ncbi:hypothetical protein [Limnobacter sp.]|uniref:hypothetical protein n=1 Tax=Limnobacter sp. TaxID=2003368 RepID=UPI003510FDF0
MNTPISELATVSALEGRVYVVRDGAERLLTPNMALRAGDVLRSTENSLAVLSIPGTQQQIPAFLEVANGGMAQLEFDPDLGEHGQVVVKSGTDTTDGTVTLVSDLPGENQAAVLEGQESQGEAFGLFGAGLVGGGALLPAAGAVGAAALIASGDDGGSGVGNTPPSPTNPTDNLGGLAETVGNLTNNLGDLTEPIPVVGDAVETVGDALTDVLAGENPNGLGGVLAITDTVVGSVGDMLEPVPVLGDVVGAVGSLLDATLTGNNNGGLSGLLTGVGEGLSDALAGTPAEVLGEGLNTALDLGGSALSGVGDAIASVGQATPLAPVTNLLADVVGTTDGGLFLGGLGSSIGSSTLPDAGGLLGGGLLGGLQDLPSLLG